VFYEVFIGENLWSRRQGVRRYRNGLFTDALGGLFEHEPELFLSFMKPFSGKSETPCLRTTLSSASLS
jgi:hypothetical protein